MTCSLPDLRSLFATVLVEDEEDSESQLRSALKAYLPLHAHTSLTSTDPPFLMYCMYSTCTSSSLTLHPWYMSGLQAGVFLCASESR